MDQGGTEGLSLLCANEVSNAQKLNGMVQIAGGRWTFSNFSGGGA